MAHQIFRAAKDQAIQQVFIRGSGQHGACVIKYYKVGSHAYFQSAIVKAGGSGATFKAGSIQALACVWVLLRGANGATLRAQTLAIFQQAYFFEWIGAHLAVRADGNVAALIQSIFQGKQTIAQISLRGGA